MILLRRTRHSTWVALSAAAVALAMSALALLGNAAPAAAATNQVSMFEIPNIQGSVSEPQDPAHLLQILRSIGANTLRVEVIWSEIAPDSGSRVRPPFNASDPSSYPAANWAPLDRLVSEARSYGIQLNLMVTGGAPLWATATGGPPCGQVGGSPVCFDNVFEPSASEYGQFVQAVGRRYPSVHFWELWNETNWGPALAPQYLNSSVPLSAYFYRGMLDAGWNALQATGHGRDSIVATSLSQDGSAVTGETGTSAPLTFIRTLWCATSSYTHLSGAAASQAGCPTTNAGYQQFKASHPALFQASGIGVHPYPYAGPPTHIDFPTPDGVEFAEIPHLITGLDRLQQLYAATHRKCKKVIRNGKHKKSCKRVYGPYKQMAAYNTEYGYQTGYTTADNEAAYINWAEYLSYKNPRIWSYDQYELQDVSWFHTGLRNVDGSFKPSFYSYRLATWLPVTSTRRRHAIEVWGNARPAYFARLDTGRGQTVWVQWAPGSSGQFRTIKALNANAYGYVDANVRFPGSGQVRLAWQYPSGDSALVDPLDGSPWIYSRVTNISVH
jgi:hypothetical protein